MSARLAVSLLAISLSACASLQEDSTPSLALSVDAAGHGFAELSRAPLEDLSDARATLNGVDLGAPVVSAGRHASGNGDDTGVQASATFAIPTGRASGESLELVVTQGGVTYREVVPQWGAPRALVVTTSLDQVLHPGDWIEVSDGVASDALNGGFSLARPDGTDLCGTQWSSAPTATGMKYQLAPDWSPTGGGWYCDDLAPGARVNAQISIDASPSPAITVCDGDGVQCAPLDGPRFTENHAVTVQL